jgi:hypothetical protein
MDVEMNERIQKLAEEAGFRYIKDEGIGWAGNHNASLPRFAELIVRECADVANDWYQNHDKIHSDPMSYVLAHFGVEE